MEPSYDTLLSKVVNNDEFPPSPAPHFHPRDEQETNREHHRTETLSPSKNPSRSLHELT